MIKIHKILMVAVVAAIPLTAQPNPDSLVQIIKVNSRDTSFLNGIFSELATTKAFQDSSYDLAVKCVY